MAEIFVFLALVSLFCALVLFRRRRRWSGPDAAVAVAIPTAWISVFYASKIAIWHYTQGQAVWFTYGGDKSLSNFVLESAIVALLVSSYLAVRATAAWSSKAFAILRVVLVGLAVLVALLVPPMGE
jgi:hypothetical protein